MKAFIFIIGCLFTTAAKAQIVVEKPIPSGMGDEVFESSYDPMVGYYFPPQLVNVTAPNVLEVGNEDRVFLNIGVVPSTLDDINKKIAQTMPGKKAPLARVMRGYNAQIIEQSKHIPPEFRPRLSIIGDAGNLAGPVNYLLTVRKSRFHGVSSKSILATAFRNGWHLGTLSYQYVAVIGGATEMAKTNVGIWAATQTGPVSPRIDAPGMKVEYNSASGCWSKTDEGIICINK